MRYVRLPAFIEKPRSGVFAHYERKIRVSGYAEANPEIDEARAFQDSLIVQNPLLNTYYGGLDVMDRYLQNHMYDVLEDKYGADIRDKQSEYYRLQKVDLLEGTRQARAWSRSHPEIWDYADDVRKLRAENWTKLLDLARYMPEGEEITTREGAPEELVAGLPEPAMTFGQWSQAIGPEMTELLLMYAGGEELPAVVERQLDYDANRYGYDSGDDLLQAILLSLAREVGQ